MDAGTNLSVCQHLSGRTPDSRASGDGFALHWHDGSASDDEARDCEKEGAQHPEGLHLAA